MTAVTVFAPEDFEAGIPVAAAAVKAGECIVLPTDTVYGIGADAFSAEAVQRLLDAKERGQDKPPPVLIAEPSMLRALTTDVPQAAKDLAAAFWPGGLTLILKVQQAVQLQLGETLGTVAVRVPNHDGARTLLRRTGPLAVSSANLSGQPAATTCQEAEEQLGEKVSVYLDSGATAGTVPSTIVDFSAAPKGRVLRLGAITVEQLREVCPEIEDETAVAEPEPEFPQIADRETDSTLPDKPRTGSTRYQHPDEPEDLTDPDGPVVSDAPDDSGEPA